MTNENIQNNTGNDTENTSSEKAVEGSVQNPVQDSVQTQLHNSVQQSNPQNNQQQSQQPYSQNMPNVYQQQVPIKQKSNCCCSFFIILFILIIVLVAVLGFFTNKFYKGIKSGSKSLGVNYSMKDYDTMTKKLGINFATAPETICLTCPVKYEGKKLVSVRLTNEEASAFIEYTNAKSLVQGTQIKFERDGIEASTSLTYNGQTLPVVIKGNIQRLNSKTVGISIQKLSIGTIPLPGSVIQKEITQGINEFVNQKLSEIDELSINNIDYGEGYFNFSGIVPQRVEGYAL